MEVETNERGVDSRCAVMLEGSDCLCRKVTFWVSGVVSSSWSSIPMALIANVRRYMIDILLVCKDI